jgi:hypothetical protein
MPVHDWTKVKAGTFHDFHGRWISHLTESLNTDLLPGDYYAQSEQRTAEVIADILTLRRPAAALSPPDSEGGLAVAEAPPVVSKTMPASESQTAAMKQRRLVVRHVTRHEVVAMIEIVSPGNKDRASAVESFVQKAVDVIEAGIHLQVIDLFPPGNHDPNGLHDLIWAHFGEAYSPPPDKPLIAASYRAGSFPTAYLEPLAIGDLLPTMPLFLSPDHYINVPLEPPYDAAWRGTPRFWQAVVEGREPPPEA